MKMTTKDTPFGIHPFAHLLALLLISLPTQVNADPNKEVLDAVNAQKTLIEEVAQTLWDKSEISLEEKESAAYLQEILKKNGFKITEKGSAGVPTAFIAEYGSGEPRLGVMLEYDALPGLGNKAVPTKEPREDGVTAGHGCGHNLIGSVGRRRGKIKVSAAAGRKKNQISPKSSRVPNLRRRRLHNL